jgi:hypothetical protein
MVAKDGRFYLRLTDEDRQLFDDVAQALGLGTTSDAVRFVMREKHRALGIPDRSKTSKPRKK